MLRTPALYGFFRRLASAAAPNRCPFCGEVISAEKYYCRRCFEFLPFVNREPPHSENISRFIACCYYRRRVRPAVLSMKYGGFIYPAEAFGYMLSQKLSDVSADVIVPVPSSFQSVKSRGFAPAELIASRVSLHTGIPVVKALRASDSKKEQKSLSAKNRAANARESFYAAPGADIRGKRVILLDDVCTTGSTLTAAADILAANGASEIIAAVFAKTPDYAASELSAKKYAIKGEKKDRLR